MAVLLQDVKEKLSLIDDMRKRIEMVPDSRAFRDINKVLESLFEKEEINFELFYATMIKLQVVPDVCSSMEVKVLFYLITHEILNRRCLDSKSFSLTFCVLIVDENRPEESMLEFLFKSFKRQKVRSEFM